MQALPFEKNYAYQKIDLLGEGQKLKNYLPRGRDRRGASYLSQIDLLLTEESPKKADVLVLVLLTPNRVLYTTPNSFRSTGLTRTSSILKYQFTLRNFGADGVKFAYARISITKNRNICWA
jgi:hypothetical protein